VERYLVITGDTLRIYTSRSDFMFNSEEGLITTIPLSAFEEVIEEFDHTNLNMDLEDDNTQQFLSKRFALKLKNDFLYLYLQGDYDQMDSSPEILQSIRSGKRQLDDNSKLVYNWYNTMEYLLYGGDEMQELDQAIIEQLAQPGDFKMFLLNKMLVFSCEQDETRQTYIEAFRQIAKYGDQWQTQEISGMDDDEVNDINVQNSNSDVKNE